jgi:hypothetical protein
MLRFAHLADAADPVMLVWGDETALSRLAALLREAALTGEGMTIGDPSQAPTISLEIIEKGDGGLTRLAGSQFRWSVRRADCERFGGLVDAVATSDVPCHNYLDDTDGQGLAIKVSKGEYPADFHR